MIVTLDEFIDGKCTDEYGTLLKQIDGHLKTLAFDQHEVDLKVLMSVADNQDSSALMDSVTGIYLTACNLVLGRCGITLADGASLEIMEYILHTIVTFNTTMEDSSLVYTTCLVGDTPEETYAAIVELRTGYPAENLLPYIYSISFELIGKVYEIAARDMVDVEETLNLRERYSKLHDYHGEVGNNVLDPFIKLGLEPTLSVESFYNHFLSQNLDKFSQENVVQSLVGSCIYSGVNLEAIRDEVDFFLDDSYPNLEDRMNAAKYLRTEISRLSKMRWSNEQA